MKDEHHHVLVEELISLINKGNAHATFEDAVKGVPLALLTEIPEHLPYGIWHLAEHMRITQLDIIMFCTNPDYQSPKWPDGYWPEHTDKKLSAAEWEDTLARIAADRLRFINLLKNPAVDLYTPFEHGTGQNLLREALLIADHNSYHTAEIIAVRRLLNDWK